jgi:hypothetical protein
LDGLVLLLVIPGYKANAKNTNNGASYSLGKGFNFGRGRPTTARNIFLLIHICLLKEPVNDTTASCSPARSLPD